ncbi:MAG: Ig-like domain-containing protein, partial [Chthoniobacteraceae bacterium]
MSLLSVLTPAVAQVNSPNTDWVTVPYRATAVVDVSGDSVSGNADTDLVGSSALPAFLTKFIPGTSSTNGTVQFRLRIGKGGGGSYGKTVIIGMDANQDGVLDLYVGSKGDIRISQSIAGALSISPSTTTLNTKAFLKKYSKNSTNYHWAAVNTASSTSGVALDPAADTAAKQDIGSSGDTDFFISFSLPFADLVAAFASKGITFNSTMPVTYVAGISSDAKTFNQDFGGLTGGAGSTTTFASLGVMTQPLYINGTAVNSPPVNTVPSSLAINASREISGVSVGDVNGNLATVQATASTGTVAVDVSGGAKLIAGASNSATLTLGGTPAQINSALATLSYTSPSNYTGPATVTVLSRDSSDATDSDNIAIEVSNTPNTPPVAANDTAAGQSGKLRLVNVTANDTDADANVLTVASATLTSGQGTVSFSFGNVSYTPASAFVGTAIIAYTISDGNGGTANATLTVTVSANVAPVAVNDSATADVSTVISIDALANDTDADGDALTITSATRTSGSGSVAIVDNEIEFTTPGSNGTTVISYSISDGYGGTASATATVVMSTNFAPVAVNDSAAANSAVAALINVLTNDTDVNNDVLTVTDATLTSGQGEALVVSNKVRYTPEASFAGTATISYTIDDGRDGTASAVLTVTVTDATVPTISAPGGGFAPLSIATGAGGTVALANYTSQAITSDNIAVTSVTQSPAIGSARSPGTTSVTLTAFDAAGNSASTNFDVTVTDGTVPTIGAPGGGFTPLSIATGAGGTVALPDYTGQAATSDNVAVTSVTQSPAIGSARSPG